MQGAKHNARVGLMGLAMAMVATVAIGCPNNDAAPLGTGKSAQPGTVIVTVTDAATDLVTTFELDITALEIGHATGNFSPLLPQRTRVNFANLQGIDEFLAGTEIAPGVYSRVRIAFDTTEPTVFLFDKMQPAELLDFEGHPLTGPVEMILVLDPANHLVLGSNGERVLRVDLNLDASLFVDWAANQVRFSPVVAAHVEPQEIRPAVADGTLISVDVPGRMAVVNKRDAADRSIANATIYMDANTLFVFDGETVVGDTGLNRLGLQAVGTRVRVRGWVNVSSKRYEASIVEVGIGAGGGMVDSIDGVVTNLDTGTPGQIRLTVRGDLQPAMGDLIRDTVVEVIATTPSARTNPTRVISPLTNQGVSTDAVNVGQHVGVFGQLVNNELRATGDVNGIIRLRPTTIYGLAHGEVIDGPLGAQHLMLDMRRVGLLDVAGLNFGNSGYLVSALTVELKTPAPVTGIHADTPIRLRGYFTGHAGPTTSRDFVAESLANYDATATGLLVSWPGAGAGASEISQARTFETLSLDLATAETAVIDRGFAGQIDLDRGQPALIGRLPGAAVYVIILEGTNTTYRSFAEFGQALTTLLADGAQARFFWAVGRLGGNRDRVDASAAAVLLHRPSTPPTRSPE